MAKAKLSDLIVRSSSRTIFGHHCCSLRKVNNAYANHLRLTWIKAPLAAVM